jgi:hypothetical protein
MTHDPQNTESDFCPDFKIRLRGQDLAVGILNWDGSVNLIWHKELADLMPERYGNLEWMKLILTSGPDPAEVIECGSY